MASEKAIETALDEWYRDEDWRDIYKEPAAFHQIRDEMRAALAAAAAVDGNPVDIRTVTAYECGFEEGKREAAVDGDAQWNAAIEAAALAVRNRQGVVKEDFDEGYNEACVDAESAIRALKRG